MDIKSNKDMTKEITNINIGYCHSRNKHFVNWQEDGKQQYFFSDIISCLYSVKDKLEKYQSNNK